MDQKRQAQGSALYLERALTQWRGRDSGNNVRLGFLLHDLSEAYFVLEDFVAARSVAEDLLSWEGLAHDYPVPDLHRYHAETLLGLIALRSGDVEIAVSHMDSSLRDRTPERLGTIPLTLQLANELLNRGKRSQVVSFLRRYSQLKPEGASTIKQWITEIETGGSPHLDESLLAESVSLAAHVRAGQQR